MQQRGDDPMPDEDVIDASAWQMWKIVWKTCGPWVACKTAVNYLRMMAKGEI